MDKDYFESEKNKIWDELKKLTDTQSRFQEITSEQLDNLKKNVPELQVDLSDIVMQARNSIKNVETMVDNITNITQKIEKVDVDISATHSEIESLKQASSSSNTQCSDNLQASTAALDSIVSIRDDIITKNDVIKGVISEINSNHAVSNSKLVEITTLLGKFEKQDEEATSSLSKINGIVKQARDKHDEINEIYDAVIGFETEEVDVEGKTIRQLGLKDELLSTYNELKEGFMSKSSEINEFNKQIKEEKQSWLKQGEQEKEALKSEIRELMPSAMAAGLSVAFENKKNDEIKERDSAKDSFTRAIWGMICVSLLIAFPIVYFIKIDKSYFEIIDLLPKMMTAFLPLYIPIFWVALSSNKKINLSKRLIEEYAHKEVLAKTFVGLSDQIDKHGARTSNTELKDRLLFNMVAVSSENPGKLIKGYNSSDHPLFELLDSTSKMQEKVEFFKNIPGISHIIGLFGLEQQKIELAETIKKGSETTLANNGGNKSKLE